MCSISHDPRCDEWTIYTAVAPDVVFTIRRYAHPAQPRAPLARNVSHQEHQTHKSASHKITQCQISLMAEVGRKGGGAAHLRT
jgi:hypothetical protein